MAHKVSIWFLLILHIWVLHSAPRSSNQCLHYNDYAYFCTKVLRISVLELNDDIIKLYLGLNYTDYAGKQYEIIYKHIQSKSKYQSYGFKPFAQLTCFEYSIGEKMKGRTLDYILYNQTNGVWQPQMSITLNNIGFISSMNEPSETICADVKNDFMLPITSEVASFSSNWQCIEIVSFFTTNETRNHTFYFEGQMWRGSNFSTNEKYLFTTPPLNSTNDDRMIEYNQMYCFEGKPKSRNDSLVFIFVLNDFDDGNREYKAKDDDITHDLLITDWFDLDGVAYYRINFSISGEDCFLQVALWQSCNITSGSIDAGKLLSEMRQITNFISLLTTIFVFILVFAGSFTIFVVAFLSRRRYRRSDPINYFAIIWMILELWDFFADVAFVIYLYFFWSKYGRLELFISFIVGSAFVFVPYCLNLFYYSFLSQLWRQDRAPFASKLWLSRYSWIFLTISIVTGGVHPALELTNSMLWPRQLFAMHLPYSELIRVRSERFVTNVLTENFPFLILQISFYFIVGSIQPELNEGNIVFYGTITSSILSVLFSGTYYFSYKYQLQSALATHSFSFKLRTDEFEHYWVHSHWRLQTAISKALALSTPSLVILDEVVDEEKKGGKFIVDEHKISMSVGGRILNDASSVKSKLMLMECDLQKNEKEEAMREIGKTLRQLLRNEFSLKRTTDPVKIIDLKIRSINNGEGEYIFELDYDKSTMKNICCWRCTSKDSLQELQFDSYYDNEIDEVSNERTIPSPNSELPMVSIFGDDDVVQNNNDISKNREQQNKAALNFAAIISADPDD